MEVTVSQEAKEHRKLVFNVPLNFEELNQREPVQLPALAGTISTLSPADTEVFRDAFQREALCYANSWLYLLRSTRNGQGNLDINLLGRKRWPALVTVITASILYIQ